MKTCCERGAQEKTPIPQPLPGTSVWARGTTLIPGRCEAPSRLSSERDHTPAPANGGHPSGSTSHVAFRPEAREGYSRSLPMPPSTIWGSLEGLADATRLRHCLWLQVQQGGVRNVNGNGRSGGPSRSAAARSLTPGPYPTAEGEERMAHDPTFEQRARFEWFWERCS